MVARLKANPAFQRDFASARLELQSLREETIAR
jgi:hypothetical protein